MAPGDAATAPATKAAIKRLYHPAKQKAATAAATTAAATTAAATTAATTATATATTAGMR